MKSVLLSTFLLLSASFAQAESLECHNAYFQTQIQVTALDSGLYSVSMNAPAAYLDLNWVREIPANQGYKIEISGLKCKFGATKFVFDCDTSFARKPTVTLTGLNDKQTYMRPVEYFDVEGVIRQTQHIGFSESEVFVSMQLFMESSGDQLIIDELPLASPLAGQSPATSCQ